MLQLLSFVLLGGIFLCSLINPLIFSVPPEKFLVWLRSLFLTISSTMTTTTTISTSITEASTKGENKDKKNKTHGQDKLELERVFATFDKNGDGFITKQELGESLKNMGLFTTEEEVEGMVADLDSNGDGLIDLDEFCELYDSLERNRGRKDDEEEEEGGNDDRERDLREAFDVFDGNGDGMITVEELGLVLSSMGLKEGIGIQDCREMIKMVDMDGDGKVNFDEFKMMMMKKPISPATDQASLTASS
ncbi:calmodulin-like protein 7 [Telopea speciosissima]|uniref:calmodulin-like protein 7 n=1 Tax=Telopea speciosissima TaxID=54955 RepID=UPI001CC81E59|nr:calmodulin-like protein 7 [Telopea speciosissima]